jgi:hypothetical protein
MSEPAPKVATPPPTVDAPSETVDNRLDTRLLPIRSVWFPTPRELRRWRESGVPLYVRRLGPGRVEVGPRLDSLWAACFAPVLEGRLAPADGHTRLDWRRRWPRFTLALLAGWWVVLVVWPVVLFVQISAGRDEAGWLPFWAFLVVASTAGPAVGWVLGGRALDEAVPWLAEALRLPEVDEDW